MNLALLNDGQLGTRKIRPGAALTRAAQPSPEIQKLVREKSPPNIKFFPMTTRRMAWLLAGVFESDDLQQLEISTAAGGIVMGDKIELMEGGEGGEKEDSARGGHRSDRNSADNRDAESHAGAVTDSALASSLAARKRAASLLYQLLITVSIYRSGA